MLQQILGPLASSHSHDGGDSRGDIISLPHLFSVEVSQIRDVFPSFKALRPIN